METHFGARFACQNVSLRVYILVMLFAMASWIDINGLWVEIPLLVEILPESWDLPSYLIIIIQVANIGPLLYTVTNRLWPNKVKEWWVIYLIILIGAVTCLLLVFLWDHTVDSLGAERSIPLIVLTSCLALVDTTSSVAFLPYMAMFKSEYMIPYYIGEGLSGLVPGLVGLIQGVGSDPECRNWSSIIYNETTGENYTINEIVPFYHPPRFSVEVFFVFLFLMLCISLISFSFLNFAKFCKNERISAADDVVGTSYSLSEHSESYINYIEMADASDVQVIAKNKIHPSDDILDTSNSTEKVLSEELEEKRSLPNSKFIPLLIMIAWVNGLSNGVLPSTQSYSSLPYSNMVYTLSVRLSTVANPLACFIAMFFPIQSLVKVAVLTFLGTILAGYQLLLAAMSPAPPLQGEVAGDVFCILTAVLQTGLFSYVKVSVASIFCHEGRAALLWVGIVTQLGSFVGAIITFILVNIENIFTESTAPVCPT